MILGEPLLAAMYRKMRDALRALSGTGGLACSSC